MAKIESESIENTECTQDMKITDSVLLSLFIRSNVKCNTPHTPLSIDISITLSS